VDNAVWLTVNSGADAFSSSIVSPLSVSGGGSTGSASTGTIYFHGSIAINFSTSITWHTDLTTAPAAGECDLYTVALHEMMHVMGFCSLLDYEGTSLFGSNWQDFSRYDTHLENNAATDHLFTTTSACPLYQNTFNPGLTPPTSILSPGGCGSFVSGETDYTDCSTAIKYAGGWSSPVPVYTPICFEPGASLSHFEDECYVPSYFILGATAGAATNNQYFVLSNEAPGLSLGAYTATTNPGIMKRYLTPEERSVLCDIGYEVNTTFGVAGTGGPYPYPAGPNLNYYDYGGTACPGLQVVGFNDGISGSSYTFSTTGTTPIDINAGTSGTSILANDRVGGIPMTAVSGGFFAYLEVMTGTGTVTATTGGFSTTVTYTAGAGDFGVQLLRYIPVSPSGVQGNVTFIYVFVGDDSCVPTACDLVSNGGFENVAAGSYGTDIPGEQCWLPIKYWSSLLATDASTVPTGVFVIPNDYWFQNGILHPLSSPSNKHFVNLYAHFAGSTGGDTTWGSSSIQEQLSSSLIAGQQYTLGFWALIGGGSTLGCCFSNQPTHLQFAVGNTYPLIGPTPPWVSAGYMPSGFTAFAEFEIYQDSFPDVLWHYYSLTFTSPVTASSLYIQNAPWDDTGAASFLYTTVASGLGKPVGIDDLSIVPLAAACPFSVPGRILSCGVPFDLSTRASVCVAGGTFSWGTLPVTAGVTTITTSSIFNPSAAYAASVAAGRSGSVPVAYTYTVSGCPRTVYTEIRIMRDSLPAIAGLDAVCAGDSIPLSDALTGGTWSSSSTTMATVGSISGVVSGVATGGLTVTYTDSANCYTTDSITINAIPGTITGVSTVCTGDSIILSDIIAGGTWSSSNTAIAVIGSSGVVSGITAGIPTITYTDSLGCSITRNVTVNALPGPVAGVAPVCAGDSLVLSDSLPAGGTWTSGDTALAKVGSSSGILAGIASGTPTITYTDAAGCIAVGLVTINSISGTITGTTSFSIGTTSTLIDLVTGGTWSSSHTTIATINSATGTVTGRTLGTATISYTSPEGCMDTILVTVRPRVGITPVTTVSANITLVPNPNNGTFILSGFFPGANIGSEVKIQVLDVLGKAVYSDAADIVQGMIHKNIVLPGNVPNGFYLLRVISNNTSQVLRFTMER